MKKLNVLYQANDRYSPYAGVSILSLLKNNKEFEEINIYLLDDDISKENISKIEKTVKEYSRNLIILETKPIYNLLENAKAPKFRDSYTTYYKLFVLNQLPKHLDRILYIDCDTIICGSLIDIKEFDFKDKSFAMAVSIYHNKYRDLVGFSKKDKAYNAGIMYFDLKKWREKDLETKLIEGTRNSKLLRFSPDQTMAILLLKEELASLDLKYNFNTIYSMHSQKDIYRLYESEDANHYSQKEIDEAFKDKRIYHYITLQAGKPWEKGNIHPHKKLWEDYFYSSHWKDMGLIKEKRSFVEKVQRFLYRLFPRTLYIWAHKFAWKYLIKH